VLAEDLSEKNLNKLARLEIRNSNHEIRNKFEAQNPNDRNLHPKFSWRRIAVRLAAMPLLGPFAAVVISAPGRCVVNENSHCKV
jgi:hypothetical protein